VKEKPKYYKSEFNKHLTAQMLNGVAAAACLQSKVKRAASQLRSGGTNPCLATVLVGDNESSALYVRNKHKAAAMAGIMTRDNKLPSSCSQGELIELIETLNRDSEVHGILVQLPLPPQINEFLIFSILNPLKDVDGLTPYNAGMLVGGRAILKPCTPAGILELLDFYKVEISGMDSIIVNRSTLVGKPLAFLLLERDATVTLCHSKTKMLVEKLKTADVVITAVGNREHFVLTADMVKPHSVIIDVGITRHGGKLAGDVDFENVKEKASWITPVPGGVGPMTVSMLLKNTITAASLKQEMNDRR
jgi:methylenetetrahydrofolate dehydrogenase (NADP+)/methenyltetrahydrofolate cyclohydrolase